jgi:co-chaperonin GroES (HSP10)
MTDVMELPEPKGYKLLIAIPKKDETHANSVIVIPENDRRKEEIASIIGLVVKMGSQAYQDPEKFPDGAWCKEGDYILMRAYSGTRFKVRSSQGDQEFPSYQRRHSRGRRCRSTGHFPHIRSFYG